MHSFFHSLQWCCRVKGSQLQVRVRYCTCTTHCEDASGHLSASIGTRIPWSNPASARCFLRSLHPSSNILEILRLRRLRHVPRIPRPQYALISASPLVLLCQSELLFTLGSAILAMFISSLRILIPPHCSLLRVSTGVATGTFHLARC